MHRFTVSALPLHLAGQVIHGLTAFLVMCYSLCAEVKFSIVKGNSSYRNIIDCIKDPRLEDFIDYFRKEHLAYAIPALLCLIFILVLPLLILLIHPLSYKLLAVLKLNKSVQIAKVTRYISFGRLKPLLDSLQSCFKDNMRFFAGLYFVYRLYSITSMLLTFMLIFHAIAQPYRVQWHNTVDTFFFGGLALINCFTLLNLTHKYESQGKATLYGTASIQLIIAIMPLVYVVGYATCKVSIFLIENSRQNNRVHLKLTKMNCQRGS